MKYEDELLIFCANIRHLRKKHGLSKKKMAQILGVGVKTITALENDVVPRRLGSMSLLRASDYFHIMPSDLFLPMEE